MGAIGSWVQIMTWAGPEDSSLPANVSSTPHPNTQHTCTSNIPPPTQTHTQTQRQHTFPYSIHKNIQNQLSNTLLQTHACLDPTRTPNIHTQPTPTATPYTQHTHAAHTTHTQTPNYTLKLPSPDISTYHMPLPHNLNSSSNIYTHTHIHSTQPHAHMPNY